MYISKFLPDEKKEISYAKYVLDVICEERCYSVRIALLISYKRVM